MLVSDRVRCKLGQNLLLKWRIIATHRDRVRRSRPRDRKIERKNVRSISHERRNFQKRAGRVRCADFPLTDSFVVYFCTGKSEPLPRRRLEAQTQTTSQNLGVTNILPDCTPTLGTLLYDIGLMGMLLINTCHQLFRLVTFQNIFMVLMDCIAHDWQCICVELERFMKAFVELPIDHPLCS